MSKITIIPLGRYPTNYRTRPGPARAARAMRQRKRSLLAEEREAAQKELMSQARRYRLPFREAARRVFGQDPARMTYHELVQAKFGPTAPQVPSLTELTTQALHYRIPFRQMAKLTIPKSLE